jgi:Fe-S cluster assembly iron-binding protein IscA
MLMLTQEAALAIRELSEGPGAEGVRITTSIHSQNGTGPALQAQLVPMPEGGDAVVDEDGMRLFVAPEAVAALDGKILDADVEDGEIRFAVVDDPEVEPPPL